MEATGAQNQMEEENPLPSHKISTTPTIQLLARDQEDEILR